MILWGGVLVTLYFVYHPYGWLMWWEFEINILTEDKETYLGFVPISLWLLPLLIFFWHIPPPLTIKCWFASGLCIEHSTLFIPVFSPRWPDSLLQFPYYLWSDISLICISSPFLSSWAQAPDICKHLLDISSGDVSRISKPALRVPYLKYSLSFLTRAVC